MAGGAIVTARASENPEPGLLSGYRSHDRFQALDVEDLGRVTCADRRLRAAADGSSAWLGPPRLKWMWQSVAEADSTLEVPSRGTTRRSKRPGSRSNGSAPRCGRGSVRTLRTSSRTLGARPLGLIGKGVCDAPYARLQANTSDGGRRRNNAAWILSKVRRALVHTSNTFVRSRSGFSLPFCILLQNSIFQ